MNDKGSVRNAANETRSWNVFSNHGLEEKLVSKKVFDDQKAEFQADSRKLDPKTVVDYGYGARSLESWHDNVHGLVATSDSWAAHMGNPNYAGFDPIFWLHHNNIERMLCIYQALYPDRYVQAGKSNDGYLLREEDGLDPFAKSEDGSLFTSKDLRDWTKSGYAMPGDHNAVGVQAKVKEYLLTFYYWYDLNRADLQLIANIMAGRHFRRHRISTCSNTRKTSQDQKL